MGEGQVPDVESGHVCVGGQVPLQLGDRSAVLADRDREFARTTAGQRAGHSEGVAVGRGGGSRWRQRCQVCGTGDVKLVAEGESVGQAGALGAMKVT